MKTIGKETLIALQQGEHKAFEEIFISYFNKTKVFINGYIKSEIDAEELAEDLFVKLWINRQSINQEKSFNAYLHTMARNSALNFLKHKFIQEAYVTNSLQTEESFSSEDNLIAKETQLLIDMAVDRMPEQRKNIYKLSRNEGLTNEEISIRLNTTKRNVESQLSLALKELRNIISVVFLFIS